MNYNELLDHSDDGIEETDEMMEAIEKGFRSLEEHGGIPLEEVLRHLKEKWGISIEASR